MAVISSSETCTLKSLGSIDLTAMLMPCLHDCAPVQLDETTNFSQFFRRETIICTQIQGVQPELTNKLSLCTWTCFGSLQSKLKKKNRYGPGIPFTVGTIAQPPNPIRILPIISQLIEYQTKKGMARITTPLHFLKVEVKNMTIGGADRNSLPPRKVPCSLYPGNFCDVFLPCSGFFSLFQSCLPHGRIIFHRHRKPRGLPPDPGKFRRAPYAGPWRRLNLETEKQPPATEKPARNYREMSVKLPKISPFRA